MQRVPGLAQCFVVALLSGSACERYGEEQDIGAVCITTLASEPDGAETLIRVVASSQNCAGDHRGASFRCELEVAEEPGGDVRVRTFFIDGKDPNTGCAPSLTATCELSVDAGERQLHFGELSMPLGAAPMAEACLPEGTESEEF